MKVNKNWLQELVDLKVSDQELTDLLPLRTIAITENTPEFIELDMKGYNRADLLSMRGVAYEVAAITDSQVTFDEPDPTKFVWVDQSLPKLNVQVEDEKLTPVYCLAKIEGLKVDKSSQEWIQKLLNSGMRTVNNIADVTNLVMLEYGQPLHSFDASEIKDETVIVRNAKAGERIVTLDQKTRDLQTTDLLITDAQKPLGLAGVMGGKNSEITDSTTTILLEAAIFDPATLRKTSNRLGLSSEASKRFYHGLTKKRLLQAFDAAIRMYQEMGGKLTALTMVGDTRDQATKVPLTLKKTQNLIGVKINAEEVENYLKKLNFEVSTTVIPSAGEESVTNVTKDMSDSNKLRDSSASLQNDSDGLISWVITPPYWRLDVQIEEDLIEEVARMYGYENIPAKPLEGELPAKIDQSLFELIFSIKSALVDQGFTELQTYSYFSTQVLNNFGWLELQNTFPLIKIANPISSETEYMRHNLWSNLVEKAGENLKYFDQVAVFEIGKTYEVVEGKIHEEYRLAMLLVDGSHNPLAKLNQVLQNVIANPTGVKQSQELTLGDKVPNPAEKELFHPNRSAILSVNDKLVGGMTEIHQRISDSFGISKKVAIAEIKIDQLR